MKTMLIELLEEKNRLGLTGLIVGVGRGQDISMLNEHLDIDMLYLIDAYKPFRLRGITNSDYVEQYDDAKILMDKYSDTVTFIKSLNVMLLMIFLMV